MSKNEINNKGFAAIMALLLVISLVLVVSFSVTIIIVNENQIDKNLVISAQSYYSAESGVEDGLLRIINSDYNYTVLNNFDLDGSAIVQNIIESGNSTIVESSSSYLGNERKIKTELIITTDDISFHYGVQVGEGGLVMGNNSSISGNLYSDGPVSGSGTIEGDLTVATGMSLDANGVWDTHDDDLMFGEDEEPTDIAMSFTPTSTGILSQVSFYVKNSSPVHGSGTIKIAEDNAGSPSTIAIAEDTFLSSKIGSAYGWANFSFSSPVNLTGGNTYWIIIDLNSENKKHFSIGRGQWNANSVSKHSSDWSSGSWTTDAAGDYNYKAWIGGLSTSVDGLIIEGDVYAHEISNTKVCGDAYYQTIDSDSSDFLNNPTDSYCNLPLTPGVGYSGSPDPPIASLPISDSNIADWKAEAFAYGTLSSSLCDASSDMIINGGKLICTGEKGFNPDISAKITLKGTLWVVGNITLENNSVLMLDSDYGENSGVVIADNPENESTSGKILVENGIVICGSQGLNVAESGCADSVGSYILMLSTHSGTDPSYAVEVRNNASGAIFYAHNGTAHIKNGADLKEVTAYKLSLEENAKVKYESGLADASFTSGPGAGWLIADWNEIQ
ncbi:hypothetical protein KAI56_00770 [Candidatus Parcubacteria bacterium]|nr:hypothetical protein [Candidatus Parcubacteria bacterium]